MRQTRWPCQQYFPKHRQSPVGAVELQRGCEGGTGGLFISSTAAFAGKPAPTFDLCRWQTRVRRDGRVGSVFPNTANLLWELSSFSEAAKAAAHAAYSSAVPPLSQASQLPPLICVAGKRASDAMAVSAVFPQTPPISCGSCRASARLRRRRHRRPIHQQCRRFRRQASSHL
jgi:hypothetical protein